MLLLLTVEYLHEEVRVAREYDLVAVDVLAVVVQLEDEIAQLAILAQRVQHLHGVREVGRVVSSRPSNSSLASGSNERFCKAM